MDQNQKAAYVQAQATSAMIEAMGMQAENQRRKAEGNSPAFVYDDFAMLIKEYGLEYGVQLHEAEKAMLDGDLEAMERADELQAEVVRLRELLASATAQIHRTQERDDWKEAVLSQSMALVKAHEAVGALQEWGQRWKAATQRFADITASNPYVPIDDYSDACKAIEGGNLDAFEKALGIEEKP